MHPLLETVASTYEKINPWRKTFLCASTVHSPQFQAMAERVLKVTELTSRLNVLPFDDEEGKRALLGQILGRALPAKVTIYPPFYTDHGLNLDLAERPDDFMSASNRRWWRPGRAMTTSHLNFRGDSTADTGW